MLRQIRRSPLSRAAALAASSLLVLLCGPSQLLAAGSRSAREEWQRRQGSARALTPKEQRSVWGRATFPGAPRPYQHSTGTLGGYGQWNLMSGNHHLAIPVVGYPGKGVPTAFVLYHNSASTILSSYGPPPSRPPISSGWTHSYNVYLEGAGTSTVTVVHGDGTQHAFYQNMDGSFTGEAGVFDTLVLNQNSTYTLTFKHGVKLNFNSSNKLSTIVDLNANTTTVAYNGSGYVSTVTDPSSRVLTLAYNGSNQLTSVTDPLSRVFSLTYSSNHLQRVTFPAPGTGQAQPYFEFGAASNLGTITSFRNRNGATWTVTYASSTDIRAPLTITDPNAETLSRNNIYGYLVNEVGTAYSFSTDGSGNRTSVTMNGNPYFPAETETWTWDSQHNMLTEETGAGNLWEFTYDSKGNVLTVEDPVTRTNGSVVKQTMTYNSLSQPLTSTDALGNVTAFTYDTAGNLTKVTDPLLYDTTHTYGTWGQRLTTTDPRGKVWTTAYDTYGNVTEKKDPLLNASTAAYNSLGWPTSATDPAGQVTNFTNDNLGRRTRATHASDSTYVEMTYDAEGAVLTVRDENGRTTTNVYTTLGWLSSVTDTGGRVTSFGYNDLGQRTSLTNARSKVTTWTLDLVGRPLRTDYPDSTNEQVTYNLEGKVATRTNGRGSVIIYSYDGVGRLTGITYPTGTNTSITYRADDSQSAVTDRTGTYTPTYNNRGEVTQLAAPQGTVSFGYDAAGNRTSLTRAGLTSATYAYDDASRMTSLTNRFSETTSFTLDAAGRVTQQNYANGTKALCTYSSGRGWLDVLEHKQSNNTVLARYEYTRDSTGRLTSYTQPSAHTVTYTNDTAYQLTREVRTGTSAYDISYTYDAAGNRLTKVQGGNTETYTYGDNNQVLTAGAKTYTHDNDGNMTAVTVNSQTTSLAWDYNNKLTGITYPNSSTNSFVTNDVGFGQRVSKTDSAGTSSFLFDGQDVIADSRADYTRGGITGLISERAGTVSKAYHGDQLGSTRGITDGTQTVTDSREYDSWGLGISSTGTTPTPFGFIGGEGYQRDNDSGLMLLGARYYDPSIGRFISRDPIGYQGGLNLYGYVENAPQDAIDPTGLKPGEKYDPGLDPAYAARLHFADSALYYADHFDEYKKSLSRYNSFWDKYDPTDCGAFAIYLIRTHYDPDCTVRQYVPNIWDYITSNSDKWEFGPINPNDRREGDLIFGDSRNNDNRRDKRPDGRGDSHVGVYINEELTISASSGSRGPKRRDVSPTYLLYARPK